MAVKTRIIPTEINLDLHEGLLQPNQARFIKNLVYDLMDSSDAGQGAQSQTGVYKVMPATEEYIADLLLPEGYNQSIGTFDTKLNNEIFVFIYNENQQHLIYRLNGTSRTFDLVFNDAVLNFQLAPEHFISATCCNMVITYLTNPDTGEKVRRSFLVFTDGFNHQRQICVEDAVATNGFDPVLFPYFQGNYDRALLINMGVPTPSDCINITEVPNNEPTLQNRLLFNTWQWRIRWYDVWGRPSYYGPISDLYFPLGNDCINAASGLTRCTDLTFKAPPPHINQVEIAYRNCNSQQWYTADVLDLYNGSIIGEWWLRTRNPEVNYNASAGTITYRFCADKRCEPIDPNLTNIVSNPQPRTSQAVATLGKSVALINNKDGFLPFPKSLRDKIHITVEPAEADESTNNFRNITVWTSIYNPAFNSNQPIFQQGITDASNLRQGFGAFKTNQQYRAFFAYQQYFPNAEQEGFVGYLAGTNNFAVSKQYFLRNTGELIEITDFTPSALAQFYSTFSLIPNGTFLQKFEFLNVPKGHYIFRIASHTANNLSTTEYQKTSTYTSGLYPLNRNNFASPISFNIGNRINGNKEIEIDACSSSYDGLNDNKILVIFDLTFTNSDIEQGYVYNTNEPNQSQYGVEWLLQQGGDGDKKANFTDHNGFFFAAKGGGDFNWSISGFCSCSLTPLFGGETGNNNNAHPILSWYLNNTSGCPNYENQPCNYVLIKGKVKLCNSDIGIPNVTVVFTRGKSTVTDSEGNYTIIASDEVLAPQRIDRLYFITNGCAFNGCDTECIEPVQVTIFPCNSCTERVINVADVFVSFQSQKGLLSGTTYPVGVSGWDWLGRVGAVQPLDDLVIPSVQETHLFSPARIRVDIDADAVFPSDLEYLTFFIGNPNSIQDYITWIVDKVEFVDNSGAVNEIAPTQIKIYYGSLIEYAKQNNFNTNVTWSFIDSETNEPVLTDTVEFLLNGDGTFFERNIISQVKYDQTGSYFLINYTSELANLKENAIIRIVRPKQCTNTEFYFEICGTIYLENGRATVQSFYLNAFDTYYINRQIPVPVQVGDETQIQVRTIGVPFEHHSPSDFWGDHCKNIGRTNVINPQETEVYREDQVAVSGVLSETGFLNFLNTFSPANKYNFDTIGLNGITGFLVETNTVLIIGQSNNCVVGYDDTIVRINEQGQVVANSIENRFGQPQTKVGNNYGCLLEDKNTIYKHEGLVQYIDRTTGYLIQHNYAIAQPISVGVCDGYLRSKIKSVQQYNENSITKKYWHGIINPINKQYLLTVFEIRSNDFVNQLREFIVESVETLAFNIYTKKLKVTYGFTPEYYGVLESDILDKQLFSFTNGIPWIHYNVFDKSSYGKIYGENAVRVIEPVLNMDNLTKKKSLSIGQYCKQSLYFADRVVTETGQQSRILKNYWLQAYFGWFAPFLCDVNTPIDPNRQLQTGENSLLDGNTLTGNWIKTRFIGDPDFDNKYSELAGFTMDLFGVEDTGTQNAQ